MKRILHLLLLLVSVPMLLSACGWRKNCEVAHNDDRTYTLRICTDKKSYDFGEPVHITFTVTNISTETLEWDGGDKPVMDIEAGNAQWSEGQQLTPALTRMTLKPDKSRTIELTWPTPKIDIQEFRGHFPELGPLRFFAWGIVRSRPGTRGSVWVSIAYRRP